MRAESLQETLAVVSFGPMIELTSQIPDLFPQQTGCPITAAGFELNNRCCNFDDASVEINRAAGWQLKRFAGTRNHASPHQATGIAEYSFGTLPAPVDQKIKFGFQTDDGALWRCSRRTIAT